MKKILSMMMAMAVILLWGGCTGDVVTDDESGAAGKKCAIGFDNGFVDHALLSRATTSLGQHHSTMGVYGWEKPQGAEEHSLFPNTKVNYVSGDDWAYYPLKYWENSSIYRFYAYAPHSENVTISGTAGNMLFAIPGITVTGSNLQATATSALKDNFSSADDTDWMIARQPQENVQGTRRDKVEFVMNHILAKIVVAAKLGTAIANDTEVTSVAINSISIDQFETKADFKQQSAPALAEWTLDTSAAKHSLQNANETALSASPMYLIESLAIPQAVSASAKVRIKYTFTYSDSKEETYLFEALLTDVLSVQSIDKFEGGNCYTLMFTIDPHCITFDAGVAEWDENVDSGQLDVNV